ncbi:MAG: hypothetical protein VKJ04_00440 [Vampirovibrionales bacterium]|nr:hypothetical protein [Vampirovibrionales bacterium]
MITIFKQHRFKGHKGNALIEYVLPAGIFAVGVAIITTTADTNQLLAGFFASGSGETASSIQDGRFVTKPMGLAVGGWQGTGSSNFLPSGGTGGSGSVNPSTDGATDSGNTNPSPEQIPSPPANTSTPTQGQNIGPCRDSTQCNAEAQRLAEALRQQIQAAPATPTAATDPATDGTASQPPTSTTGV